MLISPIACLNSVCRSFLHIAASWEMPFAHIANGQSLHRRHWQKKLGCRWCSFPCSKTGIGQSQWMPWFASPEPLRSICKTWYVALNDWVGGVDWAMRSPESGRNILAKIDFPHLPYDSCSMDFQPFSNRIQVESRYIFASSIARMLTIFDRSSSRTPLPKPVRGRIKTSHERSNQNQPVRGGLFISVYSVHTSAFIVRAEIKSSSQRVFEP